MHGKSIIIIGAGVLGLSTAYYAARQGHHVTVLDRGTADDLNCSYGNCGLIVPSHFIPLAAPGMVPLALKWMFNPESPFYLKPRLDADLLSWAWRFFRAANPVHVRRCAPLLRDLNIASAKCFKEFARSHGNSFELETKGCFCLCKTEHRLEDEAKVVQHAKELGIEAGVLSAKEIAAREPRIRMDIVGGVYFKDDCHLTPAKFMAALKAEVQRVGVAIHWSSEVTGWKANGSRIESVQTVNQQFTADEFVLCAGTWSPVIARDLSLKLPMQPGKGYSITLPEPPMRPSIPAILTEARVAVTPMGNSLRFGGTMEIAGLKEGINPARVRGIMKSVPKYYPDFTRKDFEGVQPWSGLRPCSPDGMPYIGRTSRYTNFAIGTGHAMMGLSLGPITGKLLAEIISGQKPSINIESLSPDRYGK